MSLHATAARLRYIVILYVFTTYPCKQTTETPLKIVNCCLISVNIMEYSRFTKWRLHRTLNKSVIGGSPLGRSLVQSLLHLARHVTSCPSMPPTASGLTAGGNAPANFMTVALRWAEPGHMYGTLPFPTRGPLSFSAARPAEWRFSAAYNPQCIAAHLPEAPGSPTQPSVALYLSSSTCPQLAVGIPYARFLSRCHTSLLAPLPIEQIMMSTASRLGSLPASSPTTHRARLSTKSSPLRLYPAARPIAGPVASNPRSTAARPPVSNNSGHAAVRLPPSSALANGAAGGARTTGGGSFDLVRTCSARIATAPAWAVLFAVVHVSLSLALSPESGNWSPVERLHLLSLSPWLIKLRTGPALGLNSAFCLDQSHSHQSLLRPIIPDHPPLSLLLFPVFYTGLLTWHSQPQFCRCQLPHCWLICKFSGRIYCVPPHSYRDWV